MINENIFTSTLTQLKNFLPHIFSALVILTVGWYLSGKLTNIIGNAIRKAKVDEGIITFFGSIIKILLRIIVILAVLSKVGINISSMIAALGATFVTVGIALKDSLSNIASGTIIIINKPFKVGDSLEIGTHSGRVVSIELMFTTLVTPDDKELIVPNSKLTSCEIINCSKQKTEQVESTYIPKNVKDKLKQIVQNNIITNKHKEAPDKQSLKEDDNNEI